MSCRCDRAGWMGNGHDQGCPYDGDKVPWFDTALDERNKEIKELRRRLDAVIAEVRAEAQIHQEGTFFGTRPWSGEYIAERLRAIADRGEKVK